MLIFTWSVSTVTTECWEKVKKSRGTKAKVLIQVPKKQFQHGIGMQRCVAKRSRPSRLPWLLIDAPTIWPPPLNAAPTNHVSITREKNLARRVLGALRIIRPLLQFASFFSLTSFILHFYHLVALAKAQKSWAPSSMSKEAPLKLFRRLGWFCLELSIERTPLNTLLPILRLSLKTKLLTPFLSALSIMFFR